MTKVKYQYYEDYPQNMRWLFNRTVSVVVVVDAVRHTTKELVGNIAAVIPAGYSVPAEYREPDSDYPTKPIFNDRLVLVDKDDNLIFVPLSSRVVSLEVRRY